MKLITAFNASNILSWAAALFFPLNWLKSGINFCSQSWTYVYEVSTKYSTPKELGFLHALKLSSKQTQLYREMSLQQIFSKFKEKEKEKDSKLAL